MSTAPSGWQAPKTDWAAADAPLPADLNRIEGNALAVETGDREADPSQAPVGNVGTLRQFLDWFTNRIKAITGAPNWWDAPAATLATLWAKFHESTGHKHTGGAGDAPRLPITSLDTDIATQAELDAKMHATTGHKHTGAAGDAPLIVLASITSAAKTSEGGTEAKRLAVTDANGRVGAAKTADDVVSLQAMVERNFYDDYLRQLELYYTGHFSGPEIAGQVGMTFDGFSDTNRVDTGVTDVIVDAVDKRAHCNGSQGTDLTPTSTTATNWTDAANINDGTLGTYGYFKTTKGGFSDGRDIIVDLGANKWIRAVKFYGYRAGSTGCPSSLKTCYVSFDGTNWRSITITDTKLPTTAGWTTVDLSKVCEARYIKFGFYITDADDTAHGECYISETRAVQGSLATGTLQSTTKTLIDTANEATLYLSVKTPTGTSVTPQVSADEGAHWESMTLDSSRVDPLDANYTEKAYEATFANPGTKLILKAALAPNTSTQVSPEVKRYGLHWS